MSNKVIVNGVDMIELIERDTPKKVIVVREQQIIGYGKTPYCPNCHNRIYYESLNNRKHVTEYCPKCGQKLDWGVESE